MAKSLPTACTLLSIISQSLRIIINAVTILTHKKCYFNLFEKFIYQTCGCLYFATLYFVSLVSTNSVFFHHLKKVVELGQIVFSFLLFFVFFF